MFNSVTDHVKLPQTHFSPNVPELIIFLLSACDFPQFYWNISRKQQKPDNVSNITPVLTFVTVLYISSPLSVQFFCRKNCLIWKTDKNSNLLWDLNMSFFLCNYFIIFIPMNHICHNLTKWQKPVFLYLFQQLWN